MQVQVLPRVQLSHEPDVVSGGTGIVGRYFRSVCDRIRTGLLSHFAKLRKGVADRLFFGGESSGDRIGLNCLFDSSGAEKRTAEAPPALGLLRIELGFASEFLNFIFQFAKALGLFQIVLSLVRTSLSGESLAEIIVGAAVRRIFRYNSLKRLYCFFKSAHLKEKRPVLVSILGIVGVGLKGLPGEGKRLLEVSLFFFQFTQLDKGRGECAIQGDGLLEALAGAVSLAEMCVAPADLVEDA